MTVAEMKSGKLKTFNTALAQESVNLIPLSAGMKDFQEFLQLLRERLPFNAEATRHRYANYMLSRFFPEAHLTEDLVEISGWLKGSEAFKDVVFFIILSAEPMGQHIAENVFWPSLAVGKVSRERVRQEIALYHPHKATIQKNFQAVVNSFTTLGIAEMDNSYFYVKEREGSLESFTFILHRLFPEAGIYPFEHLTKGPMVKCLLWPEKWIETQLYRLRELGILSRVSNIDGIKQFSTKYDSYRAVTTLRGRLGG